MNEWASENPGGRRARAGPRRHGRGESRSGSARGSAPAGVPGHARIVGITGPPGAGKSTLVDALARVLRAAGKTVAIIAVDPTSRISGGAILGDRIRMQQHHADPGIFIRSMATRGTTGGLSRATADLARLMDAAGKDYVIIETVGVGQDEVEIAGLAQVTVVVLVPGMGDDVQAIKAGIMEIADVFVINKADLPGADRVEQELQAMLSLGAGRRPPILRTVATEGTGIADLAALVGQASWPVQGRPGGLPHLSIDHLGIAVNSLDAALPFYEALGLAVSHRETVAAEKVHVAMLPAGRIAHRAARALRPRFTHREVSRKARPRPAPRGAQGPGPPRGGRAAATAGAPACSTSRAPARAAISTYSCTLPPPEAYYWSSFRRVEFESGNRNHRRQRALLHARLRSAGRGAHRNALRRAFGQLRARQTGRAAKWPFWRGTGAAIASRLRS